MNLKNLFTFKNIIFLILLIVVLKFVSNITEIFMIFFTAFVLASSMEPAVKFLEKKLNRAVAVLIVMTVSIVATIAFFLPVFRLAFEQIVLLVQSIPKRLVFANDFLINHGIYGKDISKFIDMNNFIAPTGDIAKNIFDHSLNATMGFFNFFVLFIAIMMIMFYFLKDKTYLTDKFVEFFPHELKEKAREIVETISVKVGGYVIAQIISSAAIWIMVTVVLFIFGVDYAVVLGLIAGTLDIIPVVGPTVALILIILAAYHLGAVKIGLIIFLYLVIQQISNSLVRPVVFGKFLDLHPLIILLSIFICAQLFGVLGVVLSPAIGATVCVLIDELYLLPMNRSK